ncbi:serine/threonine protein kinase, partial [Elaphomyces granulatus]
MEALEKSLLAIGDECERAAIFRPVLDNMQVGNIPFLAVSVRQRQQLKDLHLVELTAADCSVVYPLLFGSHHIVFALEFTDGLRWALKIPASGHRDQFDENAARALTSEALTMQLLKRETTIPIPEIYSFDASFDNCINCPFILMEFMSGIPLYDCWFDKEASEELVEQRRARTLQDLAAAMIQLNKFTYTLGGEPTFDEDGNPTGIGPLRAVDVSAMLDRMETDDPDDPDESPIFCEVGPFTDPKSFLLCMLDRREPPPDTVGQGMYKLLRLFIDWIPTPAADKPEFVLSHPDLSIQNVLVSKEGRLCGLLDWDGVAAVPRCIGNERYPSWLTRNLDPMKYCYDEESTDDTDIPEDSPKALAFYRSMYLNFMAKCLPCEDDTKLTRNSLIVENLCIAADDPCCTHEIVSKIFDEIVLLDDECLKSTDRDDFFLYDVACALANGELDEFRLQWIKRGFETLL